MQQAASATSYRRHLPIILAAAVIQGWALYGLHHAIAAHTWPAADLGWLLALYAVAVLVPVTVQLLAAQARSSGTWSIVGLMAVVLFYFGWHHGSAVADPRDVHFAQSGECFPLAIVLTVWWLLTMPFVQARLAAGHWTADYQPLFGHAWRNAVVLTEAAIFTGIFWLLLFLWQSLFHMLAMDFFRELFSEPLFVYPVTSLVFGCALHLIGSIDRFVSAVLEQILSVLKWLGTVSGALLGLFTLALIFRLPNLVFTGEKAIGAAWLLWLVAVVVLFLNAAYRDGSATQPYPKWIALSLRLVVPLTVLVSLTAIYALHVRTQHYGLTVERVWAFIVAGAALIYSIGYSVAAVRAGVWFGGVARVNVGAALALIAALALALTPILSPYRLAAASQFKAVLSGQFGAVVKPYRGRTPFQYLRFDSGTYGRHRLEELSRLQNHPQEQRIRELAAAALKLTNPWESPPALVPAEALAKLKVYPEGRSLEPELSQKLLADMASPEHRYLGTADEGPESVGLFVDLNGDGADEFVLLNAFGGKVYQKGSGGWQNVGHVYDRNPPAWKSLLSALSSGNFSAREPAWKDLWIGTQRFQVE